jgi:penicillin G amidase
LTRLRPWLRVVFWAILIEALVLGLRVPISGGLALENIVDPVHGFWQTARVADDVPRGPVDIEGMSAPVEVIYDERGVPHLFADSDADAVRAFGYVVSHDRLFQMDFLRRVTSGRLAEVLGPGLVDTDRYLRETGMARAVAMNVEMMHEEDAVDLRVAEWFAEGVNAYLKGLKEADLPVEFRLLGYRPEPWKPSDAFLVGWNLMFDLTYQREGALVMSRVRESMSPAQFDALFKVDEPYSVPIVRDEDRHWGPMASLGQTSGPRAASLWPGGLGRQRAAVSEPIQVPESLTDTPRTKGFLPGKGSNNWAVGGARSATGAPIVAGDMHLGLTLPAIWYEVHMVTPTMNTYGVTVPGVPIPIEAFNQRLGWTFTNTGADQIDHLSLELDDAGQRYRYEGEWRPLELIPDTIRVLGQDPIIGTLKWSHWGPVSDVGGRAIATKWTGHARIRTFEALWKMNHALSYAEFEDALLSWDVPMQNILVGAPGDTIAIRSTGYLPIRADNDGNGVRDGSKASSEWVGRVPFAELPHVINPGRGYLASTNQRPAGPDYPYYLGRDWRATFRSVRIDELLSGQAIHSVEQIASYQSDVHAVQRDLFVPLIEGLDGLSPAASAYRDMLADWDGSTAVTTRAPVLFAAWDTILRRMVWDEAVFDSRTPSRPRLHELLSSGASSVWLDRVGTVEIEDASDILRASLEAAADSVELAGPNWGEDHGLLLRHITGSAALRPLWRGPIPYPGFSQTLSPGAGRNVTHSASWRVVLDFQGDRVTGQGIYPGGQSGNPFSVRYDSFVADFAGFRLYPLMTPDGPDQLDAFFKRFLFRPVSP